jgi:hypothetical protein
LGNIQEALKTDHIFVLILSDQDNLDYDRFGKGDPIDHPLLVVTDWKNRSN